MAVAKFQADTEREFAADKFGLKTFATLVLLPKGGKGGEWHCLIWLGGWLGGWLVAGMGGSGRRHAGASEGGLASLLPLFQRSRHPEGGQPNAWPP